MKAGRYHETSVGMPALFLVAQDLDLERVTRLPERHRHGLRPMAEAITKARSDQLARYQRNGSHVRVVPLAGASHYLFVDRAGEAAERMLAFLEETRR
jgi:pimeloyl-ACP methyl ester carboxylesterase